MNILSLFDGMSCGQIALNRIGFKYDNYFASEIDKYAIQITQKNYPNTIQVGDVRLLDSSSFPKIDLLIGGSPCTNFSFAGTRKGMSTIENIEIITIEQYIKLKKQGFIFNGQSYLFWEYIRLLKQLKPKYFLLENVKMSKKWEKILTDAIGVEPITINSALISAQNRTRLYWTNTNNIELPLDKHIKLFDILLNINDFINEPHNNKFKQTATQSIYKDKHKCLLANAGDRTRGIGIHNDDKYWRKLTPIECERLQTIPDNYTHGVSDNQRYKMIGNGWTVDVIAHIFKNIL